MFSVMFNLEMYKARDFMCKDALIRITDDYAFPAHASLAMFSASLALV